MFQTRLAVGFLLTVIILAAFNWTRPPLETEKEVAFREWYKVASPALHDAEAPSLIASSPKIRVKVRGDSGLYVAPQEYTLPSVEMDPDAERERLTRILQLIAESQIFGMKPMDVPAEEAHYLSVSVDAGEKKFDIAVPYNTVRDNIQLQNLLQLLELFSSTAHLETVVPGNL